MAKPKSLLIMVMCKESEILRFAQNDRPTYKSLDRDWFSA